jgi:hypothetical protein
MTDFTDEMDKLAAQLAKAIPGSSAAAMTDFTVSTDQDDLGCLVPSDMLFPSSALEDRSFSPSCGMPPYPFRPRLFATRSKPLPTRRLIQVSQ